MRRLFKALFTLVLIGLLAAGGAAWWAKDRWQSPGVGAATVRILIPKGAGLASITATLADAGLLSRPGDRYVFPLGVKLTERAQSLRAGEYDIPATASLEAIAEILSTGKGLVLYSLTIPEGLTVPEVFALVSAMPELTGDLPPQPPEGSLLPETYAIQRGDTRAQVVERMMAAMARTLDDLWAARAENLPIATPQEAVILASVVEKETGLAAERPQVAAVFVNRLNMGMPLQSDPTVIYGIAPETGSLDRALLRRDLQADTPYNTYTRPGLPVGPIANPGRESIAAVLNPVDSDALYFVADGSGGHAFARTLAEHNRNVAKWRSYQRENGLR